MNIRALNNQNVCILGYGVEGRASFKALWEYAPQATITIADGNPDQVGEPGYDVIAGPDYLDRLEPFDAIIKSPGIPWDPPTSLRDRVTSATEIFMNSIPKGVTVIGVTGTKGKSTTSNLIHQALIGGGKRAFLAGNIGEPMLGFLPQATPGTFFVLELSSYQLNTIKTSPPIAIVTSFFPDHLDYHHGLKGYHEAKKNIARFQSDKDIIFYNPSYPACQEIANLSPGKKVAFLPTDFPGEATGALRGIQNRSNLAAAYLVAIHCGVDKAIAVKALEHATGLPHRQESLGLHEGIEWVNDSAASTPESTLAALETWGKRTDTVIIGGLDRGYDFEPLAKALAASPIANLVLFPDTGTKIRDLIEAIPGHNPKTYFETSDMVKAVAFARQHTQPGRVCLLSSGAPSYNLFKNFPDRARAFKEAVFGSSADKV